MIVRKYSRIREGGLVILYKMVKEVLNDKVIYEQRPKGSHGARIEVSERGVF